MSVEKEFLYVGYYIDNNNNFILKIGTTNDLIRRRYEHNRNYRKAKTHTMPTNHNFEYIWTHPLSKYNTSSITGGSGTKPANWGCTNQLILALGYSLRSSAAKGKV